jgi:hypothetical protein
MRSPRLTRVRAHTRAHLARHTLSGTYASSGPTSVYTLQKDATTLSVNEALLAEARTLAASGGARGGRDDGGGGAGGFYDYMDEDDGGSAPPPAVQPFAGQGFRLGGGGGGGGGSAAAAAPTRVIDVIDLISDDDGDDAPVRASAPPRQQAQQAPPPPPPPLPPAGLPSTPKASRSAAARGVARAVEPWLDADNDAAFAEAAGATADVGARALALFAGWADAPALAFSRWLLKGASPVERGAALRACVAELRMREVHARLAASTPDGAAKIEKVAAAETSPLRGAAAAVARGAPAPAPPADGGGGGGGSGGTNAVLAALHAERMKRQRTA